VPLKILDLQLPSEITPVWGMETYEGLHVLVRYGNEPVGWVRLPNSGQPVISAERLREAIAQQVGWELVPSVLGDEIVVRTNPGVATSVSIAVCTRDRADQLARCLRALLGLDYPAYEIIVVDNAPRDDATARMVADMPVRYVRESRPGLNWARNRAIVEARHDIIAFTDDDARPDRHWLWAIAQTLTESGVGGVTGPVVPAELETAAQVTFELCYGGMSHEFRRRIIRREGLTTQSLLWASSFGVGANMAFRREAISAVGPFDVALDVGTPTRGGGDIELFHRMVARGWTLVYEPAALVWHTHRRDMAGLREQIHCNGRAFGAYLLTCARNRTVNRLSILQFAIREWLGRWLLHRLQSSGGLPRGLVAAELAGALLSPFVYWASQAHARKVIAVYRPLEAYRQRPLEVDRR
jgi:glycosyltransferase involved in cell wall biosynthesis